MTEEPLTPAQALLTYHEAADKVCEAMRLRDEARTSWRGPNSRDRFPKGERRIAHEDRDHGHVVHS